MTFSQYWELVRADCFRYTGKTGIFSIVSAVIGAEAIKYVFWMRYDFFVFAVVAVAVLRMGDSRALALSKNSKVGFVGGNSEATGERPG